MIICNACTPLGKLIECCENLVRPSEEKKTNQKPCSATENKLNHKNGFVKSCECKNYCTKQHKTISPECSINAILTKHNKIDKAQQSSLSLLLCNPSSDHLSEIRPRKILSPTSKHSCSSGIESIVKRHSRAIIFVPRSKTQMKSTSVSNKETQHFQNPQNSTTEVENISRSSQTNFVVKQPKTNHQDTNKNKVKKDFRDPRKPLFELEPKRSIEKELGPKLYKRVRVPRHLNVSLCLTNNFNQLITYEPERYKPYPCLKSRPRCKIKSKEKDYPFLPFKYAPFIFYQICMIIDILMPYIAYVAMNESICKRNINKFQLLTRMNNFLFHARQNLFKALNLYMGRGAEEALKIKFNSIWYCLEQAKACANQLKVLKESQMFLPSSDSEVIIVILEEKKKLFKFLAKACSIQSMLPLSSPRKAISLTYIEKPATMILRMFKMDAKLMATRPKTK